MNEEVPPANAPSPSDGQGIKFETEDPAEWGVVPLVLTAGTLALGAAAMVVLVWPPPIRPGLDPWGAMGIFTIATEVLFGAGALLLVLPFLQPRLRPAVTNTGIRFHGFIPGRLVDWPFSEMRELVMMRKGSYTFVEMRARRGSGHFRPVVVRFFDPDDRARGMVNTMATESGVRVHKRQ